MQEGKVSSLSISAMKQAKYELSSNKLKCNLFKSLIISYMDITEGDQNTANNNLSSKECKG